MAAMLLLTLRNKGGGPELLYPRALFFSLTFSGRKSRGLPQFTIQSASNKKCQRLARPPLPGPAVTARLVPAPRREAAVGRGFS